MCIAYGSVNQAVSTCPMCKVFPHSRCPHKHDVCRNRTLHPRIDVLYIKNAEVDHFNGCGYCKWARTNPPLKSSGYNNPGWPGCCRSPTPNEYRMISPADWRSVSTIHHIPIPPDVKATLDSISPSKTTSSSTGSPRSPTTKPSVPTLDRKNSGNASPPTKAHNIPSSGVKSKARAGGSPSMTGANLSRSPPSSSPGSPTLLDSYIQRRSTPTDPAEKPKSANSSPNRKVVDLEGGPITPRRNSGGRSTLTGNASTTSKAAGGGAETRSSPVNQSPERRKLMTSSVSGASKSSPPPPPSRPGEKLPSSLKSSPSTKEPETMSSKSGSSGSSDSTGSGSMSDNTVTSDGGFTDYLSDESEAELQRQAEARAALLAQNQAEELEFKAVRQQLAHVDLRPPKSWNPTNITNTSVANSPRAAAPPVAASAVSSRSGRN